MGRDGSAGHSGVTPVKQAHFEAIVRTHLAIVAGIRQRYQLATPYVQIDLTAGPGLVDGREGSPLIFTRCAREVGVPYLAFFCERAPASVDALQRRLLAAGDPTPGMWHVLPGDYRQTIDSLVSYLRVAVGRGRVYGMIYADDNNGEVPHQTIRRILEVPQFSHLDVMVNAAGAPFKRENGAFGRNRSLRDDLNAIGKPYAQLRALTPGDHWQFSQVLLYSWAGFPRFESMQFVDSRSPLGRAIFDRISRTRTERRAQPRGQEPFPFGNELPIAAMPNISDTRGFSPSGRSSSIGPVGAVSGAGDDLLATHTISDTRRGAPSIPRTISSLSVGPATRPFMASPRNEDDDDGSPACVLCGLRWWDHTPDADEWDPEELSAAFEHNYCTKPHVCTSSDFDRENPDCEACWAELAPEFRRFMECEHC
jgi:hypothetical protein